MAPAKKADDQRIIELNSIGISLRGIAKLTGVHHTTVASRLKEHDIEPADTRRSFTEEIYRKLSPNQRDFLISQVNAGRPIKDYVRALIIDHFVRSNQTGPKP